MQVQKYRKPDQKQNLFVELNMTEVFQLSFAHDYFLPLFEEAAFNIWDFNLVAAYRKCLMGRDVVFISRSQLMESQRFLSKQNKGHLHNAEWWRAQSKPMLSRLMKHQGN